MSTSRGPPVGVGRTTKVNRFDPHYRIDMVFGDNEVATVFDCVSVTDEAGFVSAAAAWVEPTTLAPSA